MSDKIAEIRARHVLYPPSINARHRSIMAYQDIATLLAEDERHRAEIERLRGHVALVAERARQLADERDYAWGEVEKQRVEIERMRAALKDINALDPDVPDALAADALRVVVAQMGDLARNALEGKP